MILLQVNEITFWDFIYDHGVNIIAAAATLGALIIALRNIVENNKKEMKEAETRSERTLEVLDFIFEYNNHQMKEILKSIRYIRENTDKGLYSAYKIIIKGINDKDNNTEKDHYYYIDPTFLGLNVKRTYLRGDVLTEFETNYITLTTYGSLRKNLLTEKVKNYEEELKINLKNQHLNLTSDGLKELSDKINGLKEVVNIFDSIKIQPLFQIALYERKLSEEEINEEMGADVEDVIKKELDKFKELEKTLEEIVKDLHAKD